MPLVYRVPVLPAAAAISQYLGGMTYCTICWLVSKTPSCMFWFWEFGCVCPTCRYRGSLQLYVCPFVCYTYVCLLTLRKTKEWCQWVASPQKRLTRTMYPWVPTPRHTITPAVCQSRCTNRTMCPWPRAPWSSPLWESRSPRPPTWASAPVPRPLLAGQCSATASPRLWTEISNLIAKVRGQ